MNFLNFIKSFIKFTPPIFTGVANDTRSEDEKELDPLHEEVAGGLLTAIPWTIKPPEQWKKYTLRNQNLASFDCVAFSSSTGVEADKNLGYPLSARDIYDRRSNYPEPGMIPMEGVSIPAKYGVVKNSTLPSDNLTEDILNMHFPRTDAFISEAQEVAGGIPVKLGVIDINTIAELISKGFSVRLCFHFDIKEWTAIPQLLTDGDIHHQIIAVDWAIVNGKKCIIAQDSCFPNTTYVFPHGLRAITESFLINRCYAATYIKPAIPVPAPLPAPQHIFTIDMGYGEVSNEVTLLQTKLHSLGFFNVNPTGYFGGLTKQAVMDYQKAHNILPISGFAGPLTRASLNAGTQQ